MSLPLSIFIITCNEAARIGRTIAAVRDLTDDLVVVDSGSSDGTPAIAEALGAKVIHHTWEGYSRQKRFAEDQCRHAWRLNLDADEVVTTGLSDEIQRLFTASEVPAPGAYAIRIVDVIPGDVKPRAFAYAHKYVRLYHQTTGQFETSPVHDVVRVHKGVRVQLLHQPIHHFSMQDISTQVAKFNNYTDALVEDMRARHVKRSAWRLFTEFPAAFLKAYFLRRHFMRGRYGFVTAMNYAYFRYLKFAKYRELQNRRS